MTPFHDRNPRPLSGYEIERMMIADRLKQAHKPRWSWLRRLAARLRRKPFT